MRMVSCDNCGREVKASRTRCPHCNYWFVHPTYGDVRHDPATVPLSTRKDPARPDEIAQAKEDGCCPRCETNGDFVDIGGRCVRCGFSY